MRHARRLTIQLRAEDQVLQTIVTVRQIIRILPHWCSDSRDGADASVAIGTRAISDSSLRRSTASVVLNASSLRGCRPCASACPDGNSLSARNAKAGPALCSGCSGGRDRRVVCWWHRTVSAASSVRSDRAAMVATWYRYLRLRDVLLLRWHWISGLDLIADRLPQGCPQGTWGIRPCAGRQAVVQPAGNVLATSTTEACRMTSRTRATSPSPTSLSPGAPLPLLRALACYATLALLAACASNQGD